MNKSECIESQYYADEYFTYGEDGAIYDRDTGEKVARWDEPKNSAHVHRKTMMHSCRFDGGTDHA